MYFMNEITFSGYNEVNLDVSYIIAILLGILPEEYNLLWDVILGSISTVGIASNPLGMGSSTYPLPTIETMALYLLFILSMFTLFERNPVDINLQHVTFRRNGRVYDAVMDNNDPSGRYLQLLYQQNTSVRRLYINYYGTRVMVLCYMYPQ